MIQRIQTLFLSIALLLLGLLFFIPMGELVIGEKIYTFTLKGIVNGQNGQAIVSAWHLLTLLITMLVIQLVVIFSYKKRITQIRLATINLLLMAGFVVAAMLFIRLSHGSLGDGVIHFKLSIIHPLISIIFNYLAIRAIKKDEALVRSIDRIR